MKFPFRHLNHLEDAVRNFEFLEQSGIYWGVGAPSFVPQTAATSSGGIAAFYFRQDTPGTANKRIYVWNGSTWTGVL